MELARKIETDSITSTKSFCISENEYYLFCNKKLEEIENIRDPHRRKIALEYYREEITRIRNDYFKNKLFVYYKLSGESLFTIESSLEQIKISMDGYPDYPGYYYFWAMQKSKFANKTIFPTFGEGDRIDPGDEYLKVKFLFQRADIKNAPFYVLENPLICNTSDRWFFPQNMHEFVEIELNLQNDGLHNENKYISYTAGLGTESFKMKELPRKKVKAK